MPRTATITTIEPDPCLACLGVPTAQLLRITLLKQLLTLMDPMASTDNSALLDEGKCFACYGMSIPDVLELALLKLIYDLAAAGGGLGGADEIFSGNYGGGVPTDVPTTTQAIAFDTSNGTQWNYYSGTWH